MLSAAAAARAQVTTYSSRAAFTAANPGLTTADFETARVAAGSFTTIASPLDSATNNAVFQPGEIPAGLTVSDNGTLVVLGSGTVTGASKSVGTQSFSSTLDLIFAPGTGAAGFDFFGATGPGAPVNATIEIRTFSSSGQIDFLSTPSNSAIQFYGVSSAGAPITRINIGVTGGAASTFVDNVAFTPAVAGPEPGTLALLGAGMIPVARVAAARRRRRGMPR